MRFLRPTELLFMAIEISHLSECVTFQKRGTKRDGFGNHQDEWEDSFHTWAGFHFMQGGEAVMEARLVAAQTAIVTIHRTATKIEPHWRILDRTGQVFLIKEKPRLSDCGHFHRMLVQSEPVSG